MEIKRYDIENENYGMFNEEKNIAELFPGEANTTENKVGVWDTMYEALESGSLGFYGSGARGRFSGYESSGGDLVVYITSSHLDKVNQPEDIGLENPLQNHDLPVETVESESHLHLLDKGSVRELEELEESDFEDVLTSFGVEYKGDPAEAALTLMSVHSDGETAIPEKYISMQEINGAKPDLDIETNLITETEIDYHAGNSVGFYHSENGELLDSFREELGLNNEDTVLTYNSAHTKPEKRQL